MGLGNSGRTWFYSTWVVYCWNMPGPSCRVTILFLQLHCLVPLAGFTTFLSRTTWFRAQA